MTAAAAAAAWDAGGSWCRIVVVVWMSPTAMLRPATSTSSAGQLHCALWHSFRSVPERVVSGRTPSLE